jgi:hypothetical protein
MPPSASWVLAEGTAAKLKRARQAIGRLHCPGKAELLHQAAPFLALGRQIFLDAVNVG